MFAISLQYFYCPLETKLVHSTIRRKINRKMLIELWFFSDRFFLSKMSHLIRNVVLSAFRQSKKCCQPALSIAQNKHLFSTSSKCCLKESELHVRCRIDRGITPVHIYHSLFRKEGNVLFNDALNTFYLQLYGVGYMVKDHSDSERENPLPIHGLFFSFSNKGSLYASADQASHRQDSTYHVLCYTSRGTK